jgi:hypothetical protein
MSYLGFNISTAPIGGNNFGFSFPVSGVVTSETNDATNSEANGTTMTNQKSEEEILLERYGLSWSIIESSRGQVAADRMWEILQCIDDDSIPVTARASVASALLTWHSSTAVSVRDSIYSRYYFKTLEMIRFIIIEPDNDITAGEGTVTMSSQKPGYFLAQWLQRHTTDSRPFAEKLFKDLIVALRFIAEKGVVLSDPVDGQFDSESSAVVRAETVKTLLRCLPRLSEGEEVMPGSTKEDVNNAVQVLLTLTDLAGQRSHSLGQEAAEALSGLSTAADSDALNEHLPALLSLLHRGHGQVFHTLKRVKQFTHPESSDLHAALGPLLDCVGFSETSSLMNAVAEINPMQLVPHIGSLVSELERCEERHRGDLLGVMLSVALLEPAALIDHLTTATTSCLTSLASSASSAAVLGILVPLIKVLAAVGTWSDTAALQSLKAGSRLVRHLATNPPPPPAITTDAAATPRIAFTESTVGVHVSDEALMEAQVALLELFNALKDKCPYCNLFSNETIAALETMRAANPVALDNLLLWNRGQRARVGDRQALLQHAGQLRARKLQAGGGSALSSPSTAVGSPAVGTGSVEKKGFFVRLKSAMSPSQGGVAPSPQSQTIAAVNAASAASDQPLGSPLDLTAIRSTKLMVATSNKSQMMSPASPQQQMTLLQHLNSGSAATDPTSPPTSGKHDVISSLPVINASNRQQGLFNSPVATSSSTPALSFAEFMALQQSKSGSDNKSTVGAQTIIPYEPPAQSTTSNATTTVFDPLAPLDFSRPMSTRNLSSPLTSSSRLSTNNNKINNTIGNAGGFRLPPISEDGAASSVRATEASVPPSSSSSKLTAASAPNRRGFFSRIFGGNSSAGNKAKIDNEPPVTEAGSKKIVVANTFSTRGSVRPPATAVEQAEQLDELSRLRARLAELEAANRPLPTLSQ